jgi:hypothetical protein
MSSQRDNRRGALPPLDDILTVVVPCADILVARESRRAYRRLRADIIEASAGWEGSEARKRMILEAYLRRFRERLGLPEPGEGR